MDLSGRIKSAENGYLQILEEYFASVYDEDKLPSHGLSHHRRVWLYAKELTEVMAFHDRITDPAFPQSLIVACYLHDAAMSADPGPRHGLKSAELCRNFMVLHHLKADDFPGTISAILDHDNKDYDDVSPEINLTSILSAADDLDAFGFTGIYRYIEIYSARGIVKEELGPKIRENAGRRISHFKKLFSIDLKFAAKHIARWELLDAFFSKYENERATVTLGMEGYCRVMEILVNTINTREKLIETARRYRNDKDHIIKWYFKGLIDELTA